MTYQECYDEYMVEPNSAYGWIWRECEGFFHEIESVPDNLRDGNDWTIVYGKNEVLGDRKLWKKSTDMTYDECCMWRTHHLTSDGGVWIWRESKDVFFSQLDSVPDDFQNGNDWKGCTLQHLIPNDKIMFAVYRDLDTSGSKLSEAAIDFMLEATEDEMREAMGDEKFEEYARHGRSTVRRALNDHDSAVSAEEQLDNKIRGECVMLGGVPLGEYGRTEKMKMIIADLKIVESELVKLVGVVHILETNACRVFESIYNANDAK